MNQDFVERFRAALRIKTFWPGNTVTEDAAVMANETASLIRFQDFLAGNFPAFNKTAERWVLSPYSLAYRWPGVAKNDAPVLLMGHYDVVPAETAKWTTDPFGAELKDGFIYGRGALDMKNMVVSMMQSAEDLCGRGFRPARDIWFVFGGDEERTGIKGAKETAKWFAERQLHFAFILDEGTPVAEDMIRGARTPLALVGIEEKGFLSLDLTVEQQSGHASQPPEQQAAAILGRALLRLSRRPFPWRLTPAVESFFRQLGGSVSGINGFVMKYARFLGPLFFRAAAVNPATRALFRTTLAMTQLEGSAADNVMPSSVRAVINLRLLPPWTVDTAVTRIRKVIADEKVSVTVHGLGTNPVKAGPDQAEQKSRGWKEIKNAIAKTFPGIPVLPFIMLATTDSRHYKELSANIYRFNPLVLDQKELSLVHSHDERISLENLERCLQFYTALLEQL